MRSYPARLTLLSLSTVVLLVLTGCGGGDQPRTLKGAENAVEDYIDALVEGDKDACDMETSKYRDELTEEFGDFSEDVKTCPARVQQSAALLEAFDTSYDDATYKARDGDSKNQAIVTMSYTDDEGVESSDEYVLVYRDGTWLLSGELGADGDDEGDAEGDGEDAPAETVLPLTKGTSLELEGSNDSGDAVPFTVTVDTITCETTHPGVGPYGDEIEDLKAADGNQVCIVELAATNNAKKPGIFSADEANLRTADDTEYSEVGDWDDQGWLQNKDREPSYTMDNVQPAQTKYAVVAYELPLDAEPASLVFAEDY